MTIADALTSGTKFDLSEFNRKSVRQYGQRVSVMTRGLIATPP
jgi:hypothetical protein